MPITRRQFELEIDIEIEGWMEKISAFLAEHKDEAFKESELWYALWGDRPLPLDVMQAFDRALEKLSELEAVEFRKIRDEWYYSYGRKPLEI
jgi:hypothetical protein